MIATVQTAIQQTEKGWRFAEAQWFCADCGIVSNKDVKKEDEDEQTGVCRCGKEITQTTF